MYDGLIDCLYQITSWDIDVHCMYCKYLYSPWLAPHLVCIRYATFQGYCRELKKRKKQRTFIVKPANGAMGNG